MFLKTVPILTANFHWNLHAFLTAIGTYFTDNSIACHICRSPNCKYGDDSNEISAKHVRVDDLSKNFRNNSCLV